jgi:hypothetical protein
MEGFPLEERGPLPKTVFLKHLRSPQIDSEELIPPSYVSWRAGTTTLFLAPIDCSKISEPEFVNISGAQGSIPRNQAIDFASLGIYVAWRAVYVK